MNEELEKALTTIKQVCAAFTGNLEQHQGIQKSVQTIEQALQPKPEAKEE